MHAHRCLPLVLECCTLRPLHNVWGVQDDEAQLLAELARIKAERAEDAAKAAAEVAKKAEDDVRAEVGSLSVPAVVYGCVTML